MQNRAIIILSFCFATSFAYGSQNLKATPTPSPLATLSATDIKLEKRIRALEKRLNSSFADSEESNRDVQSYLNTKLTFGGFFETALTSVKQSDHDIQIAASTNALGINLGAEFTDNLRFVSQLVNYLNIPVENINSDPRGSTVGLTPRAGFKDYSLGTYVTQGYLEFSSSEFFNVQVGEGYAPFGIVFQQYEPVLFVRRAGPQLLSDSALVFPLWQGVHLHGIFPLHTSHSGYDLYTFSPTTNTQVLAGGGHLWWKSSEEQVSLGVSQQIKKNGSDTVDTLGADARVKFAPFTLTSEFAKNFGSGDQPWSFYIEPDYDLNDQSVILYVFADYLVNPINVTGTSAASFSDPFKKWQYGTGVNWLPTSYTRLRGGITFNQYLGDTPLVSASARNYWSLDFSAGLAF